MGSDYYRLISICSAWFLLLKTAESETCTSEIETAAINHCDYNSHCDDWHCNCVYFSKVLIECFLTDTNVVTCCRARGSFSSNPDPGISCNLFGSITALNVSVNYDCNLNCCETASNMLDCSYSSSCSSTISSYVTISHTESDITSDSTLTSAVTHVIISNTTSIVTSRTTSSITTASASSIIIPSFSNNTASSIVVPVVAGVLSVVCVLVLCAIIGTIATLCVILSHRKAKHQIPVNQQPGTTDSLLRMDNVYYAVTQTTRHPQDNVHYSRIHSEELPHVQHPATTTYSTLANTQTDGDGDAPTDYSMVTLENMSPAVERTAPAAGAVYSTVVRIDGKKTTVTNRVNEDTVCDDPDYFDDPSLLQQIRANKQQ